MRIGDIGKRQSASQATQEISLAGGRGQDSVTLCRQAVKHIAFVCMAENMDVVPESVEKKNPGGEILVFTAMGEYGTNPIRRAQFRHP